MYCTSCINNDRCFLCLAGFLNTGETEGRVVLEEEEEEGAVDEWFGVDHPQYLRGYGCRHDPSMANPPYGHP
jgi:hypothetical protein